MAWLMTSAKRLQYLLHVIAATKHTDSQPSHIGRANTPPTLPNKGRRTWFSTWQSLNLILQVVKRRSRLSSLLLKPAMTQLLDCSCKVMQPYNHILSCPCQDNHAIGLHMLQARSREHLLISMVLATHYPMKPILATPPLLYLTTQSQNKLLYL